MPLPILDGPHVLSLRLIQQTLPKRLAGVYVLSAQEGGIITARRIGRTDDDLASALTAFLGLYSHFSCASAASPASAYAMECELYHAWKLPENPGHPAAPAGEENGCPVCGR